MEAKLAKLQAGDRAAALNYPQQPLGDLPAPVKAGKPQANKGGQSNQPQNPNPDKSVHSPHINMAAFWTIAILSILLANAPGINILFTPAHQFVIMIHLMQSRHRRFFNRWPSGGDYCVRWSGPRWYHPDKWRLALLFSPGRLFRHGPGWLSAHLFGTSLNIRATS